MKSSIANPSMAFLLIAVGMSWCSHQVSEHRLSSLTPPKTGSNLEQRPRSPGIEIQSPPRDFQKSKQGFAEESNALRNSINELAPKGGVAMDNPYSKNKIEIQLDDWLPERNDSSLRMLREKRFNFYLSQTQAMGNSFGATAPSGKKGGEDSAEASNNNIYLILKNALAAQAESGEAEALANEGQSRNSEAYLSAVHSLFVNENY